MGWMAEAEGGPPLGISFGIQRAALCTSLWGWHARTVGNVPDTRRRQRACWAPVCTGRAADTFALAMAMCIAYVNAKFVFPLCGGPKSAQPSCRQCVQDSHWRHSHQGFIP